MKEHKLPRKTIEARRMGRRMRSRARRMGRRYGYSRSNELDENRGKSHNDMRLLARYRKHTPIFLIGHKT